MQVWEYKVVPNWSYRDASSIMPMLTTRGREGWELVNVVLLPIERHSYQKVDIWFKRPIESEPTT